MTALGPSNAPSRQPAWQTAGLLVLLAAAYFAGARLGLALAFVHSSASAVWPPTGIAIGMLTAFGLRLWPAVFVAAFLANVDNGGHAPSSLLIALGNTLGAVVGSYAVRRWAGGTQAFERPRDVFRFLAFAGAAAPLVSATIGVTSLLAFGLAPEAQAAGIWQTWWLGDATGAIVLAPAIILLTRSRATPLFPRYQETALMLAGATVMALFIWGPWAGDVLHARPVALLAVPFLLWGALRCGPATTAVGAVVVDVIAVWGTLSGRGPFALGDPNEALLYLQLFVAVLALLVLPTAALAFQQQVAQTQLKRAASELEQQVRERTAQLAANLHRVAEAERVTGRGSWDWDVRTHRATWSEGMYRLFGVDPATFANTNENFLAMVHPEDRERMIKAMTDALAAPGRFLQEYRLKRPDGVLRHLRGEGQVVTDADGKPSMLYGVVVDVTALRAAEEAQAHLEKAVASSEARMRTIFASSQVGIILARKDGTIVDLNPAAEALWGQSRETFLDPAFRMGSLYEDPTQREKVINAIQREGRAHNLELRMLRGGRDVRRMNFNVEIIKLEGESVFLASGLDVTELRESEERFRLLFETNPVAVAIKRADGTGFVDANSAFERLVGHTRSELIDRAFDHTAIWEDPRIRESLLARLRSDGHAEGLALRVRRADGDVREVLASVQLLNVAGESTFLLALQDVTEAKAAQAEVQRAQERFERVFQASPVAISLTKENGTFVDVNDAFCDLVARPREVLLSGQVKASDVWEDPQERQRMLIAIRDRGVVRDLELRVRRPDSEVRTALASVEFIDLGGSTTILSILQDITDRLRLQGEREARIASEAELERLRRTDRFRTEFINSTAHELATPLTPLVLGVKLLGNGPLSEVQRQILTPMERSVERLRRLVGDMVGAADLQARTLALDRRRLNLTRELRAATAALRPAAERAGIALADAQDAAATVSADPARLQLVLGHLLGNAIKFTPANGRVDVGSIRDGDTVRIEVRDTGAGLTRKEIGTLWKPFAQAHDKSQRTESGSGLGLYVTKGIIELHGGEVGVSSPGPGEGSTFWFTLPLAPGHVDPLAKTRDEVPRPTGPKRDLNPGVTDPE